MKTKDIMTTLFLKAEYGTKPCETSIYTEVIGHNGKKFQIKLKSMNGNYLGFNYACYLSVMGENGNWEKVVDNQDLGFSSRNDDVYYISNNALRKTIFEDNANHFKEYIKAVY